MLVLARKVGESIMIDEQITVTIIDIRGDRVKLAIGAPPTVPIVRREIQERAPQVAGDQILVSQAAETVPAL